MQMKPFSPPHGNPKKNCKIFVKQLTFAATSFMIYVYTDDRTERSEINSNKINKEERNMDNQELNLEQMEQVSGGKAVAGGVKNKPALKTGPLETGPLGTGPLKTGPLKDGRLKTGPLKTDLLG